MPSTQQTLRVANFTQQDQELTVQVAAMCTLVCACDEMASTNLLGNFRSVLERAEGLQFEVIEQIEDRMLSGLLVRTG